MSSVRGGAFRGRARGNTFGAQGNTPFRGASSTRGQSLSNTPRRGNNTGRAGFGQTARGHGLPATTSGRGGFPQSGGNTGNKQSSVRKAGHGGAVSSGSWQERQEQLQKHRDQERKDAVAQGLMSDPDKQIGLSEAITIKGTCRDMCPENERVLRTVRNEVWAEEKQSNSAGFGSGEAEPDEARMVKAFRRSAAGDEVQLPSDLRPPGVLKRTCDYLFNEVIGNAPALGKVHHFVWDRTRAIRNDFSIQQLTKLDDLRIAIECYERIARFHIVSLHELAGPNKPYGKYDPQQEKEQLDRTLLSLMQYYEDTRGRLDLASEAEFRAYCVILQLRDPTPDLEDRIQSWPSPITQDYRVRTAIEVYTTACSTIWPEGPIDKTQHVIARQDWEKFWMLIHSRRVSYLLACVAETHFMMIREMALSAIVRSARVTKKKDGVTDPNTEWTVDELDRLFYFDSDEDLENFCARWNLDFQTRQEDGQEYLDIRYLAGKPLPKGDAAKSSQLKSTLVEEKRHGRTIPAVIDGFSVRQAQDAGLVVEEEHDEEGMTGDDAMADEDDGGAVVDGEDEDEESLFIPETKQTDSTQKSLADGSGAAEKAQLTDPARTSSPFGQPNASFPFSASPFGRPSSGFNFKPAEVNKSNESSGKQSPFDFLSAKPQADTVSKPVAAPMSPSPTSLGFSFSSPTNTTTTGVLGGPLFDSAKTMASRFGQSTTPSSAPTSLFAPKPAADSTPSMFSPPTTTIAEKSAAAVPSFNFSNVGTKSEHPPAADKPIFQFGLMNGATAAPFSPSTTTAEKSATAIPSFNFSSVGTKSEQPPAADKPIFQFGLANGAPAAPSLSVQPETNLKSAPSQAQPHSPSTSQQTTHTTQNATVSNAGPQSPPRRPSATSWEAHKTKKPSPLSNSFTAGDENASNEPPSQSDSTYLSVKQPFYEPLSDKQSTKPVAPQTKAPLQSAPEPSAGERQLQRLAENLTFDAENGFLKQFLDFTVKQVIIAAQEKVFDEKCRIKCRALEERRLIREYGLWWRGFARHRRLAAKSRARRERTRERLRKSTAGDSLDGYSDADTASVRRNSLASSGRYRRDRKDVVDALFKSVAGDMQATAGSKRAASAHERDTAMNRETSHKRQKSMSHVNDRGRVSKTAPTSHPNEELFKRSSFLGLSSADDQTNGASTTKSTYFRMKALGLATDRGSNVTGEPRGTKRQRSESLDIDKGPSSRVSSPPTGLLTSEQRRDRESMPPPATRSKTNDEDEALFARLRAAREALQEGESLIKDEYRRSMSGSLSSNESPSMERARAEAKLRLSHGSSDFGGSLNGRAVPAYQLRESRFVPREEYALARERALERRASRSRDNSRPGSRADDRVPESSTNAKVAATSRTPTFDTAKTNIGSDRSTSAPKVNGQKGGAETQFSGFGTAPAMGSTSAFSGSTGAPAGAVEHGFGFGSHQTITSQQPPSQGISRDPFSQSSSFAPPATNNSNPFLQGAAPRSFGTPFGKPTVVSNDHTVQPSQINQSLAHTFGRPAAPTTQGSPTLPQTNSYMPSAAAETVTLLSDDEEDAGVGEVSYGQGEFYGNGIQGTVDPGNLSGTQAFGQNDQQAFMQGVYGYANSFAALADQTGEDDESEDNEPEEDEPQDDEQSTGASYLIDNRNKTFTRVPPDSYQYTDDEEAEESYDEEYDEDGNPVEGYDEDEDEDDEVAPNGYYEEEGEEYDDEEEEGDYDEDEEEDDDVPGQFASLNHAFNQRSQQGGLRPDPALQAVGNTAEEAIELSD